MRKHRKSVWLPAMLLIYTTAMAVYFLPRNTEVSDVEKYATLGLSYVIVALLWWVLRKKERMQEQREQEEKNEQ